MDEVGVAEVPAHCPGDTTLGLKDLGFRVGAHAGEEEDGIGVPG